MKKLSLIISTSGLEMSDTDRAKPVQEIVAFWIDQIILQWASQPRVKPGSNQQEVMMEEADRKMYWKVSDAIDKAVKDKAEYAELDDEWMGFIKKCKREVKLMPSKILRKIEALIEEVQDR